MSKYIVHIYFEGSVPFEVNALNEQEARDIAYNKLEEMPCEEIVANLQTNGSDVYDKFEW